MTTILHSIDTGGPGGAETIFTTLAAHPAAGVRHVAIAKPGDWVEQTLKQIDIDSTFVNTRGSFNREYLNTIVKLVRAHKVDLIQSHLYGSNLYCTIAGRLTGTPVVATFHGARDLAAPGLANGLKRRIVQYGSASLVAVSKTLRSELIEAGFRDNAKLSVVYNGVDIDRFQSARRGSFRSQLNIADNVPLIGALGNVRKPKGYEILVAALAELRRSLPEAQLVIAGQGSGDLMQALRQQIADLGLQTAVHLPGFVDDTPAFLADIDVYCSSSHSEGFSLTCVEAMASKTPVVATRSGGPEEILTDGETGLLVPTANPSALAEALARTLADGEAAQARVDRALRRAEEHFSVKAMIAGYHALQRQHLPKAKRW